MAESRRIVRRRSGDGSNGSGPSKTPSRRPSRQSSDTGDGDDMTDIHGGWTDGQKQMDKASPFAQALKLEEKGQIIKFLSDTPYANFRRHWVDRASSQPGGGTVRRAYVCPATVDKDCPLCDIGDRAQAVSAFNVVVLGDDGQLLLKTWDVGARLFQVLKAYNTDPKIGPLSRHYFLVNKTGKMSNAQTNVTPIKTSALSEDWDVEPADDDELAAVKPYTPEILEIPKRKELNEIAAEIADEYD
jgi:hypothetical protein